jgi:hypothetical protein
MRQTPALPEGSLVLQAALGEGTFGKVYTGVCAATQVPCTAAAVRSEPACMQA